MKHETIRELLALRLYREIDRTESAALELHLASCAECTRFGRELEGSLGRLAQASASAAPEDLPSDWAERLAEVTRTPHARVRPSARRTAFVFAAGLAAGLLLMLSIKPAPRATEADGLGRASPFVTRSTPPPPASSRAVLAQLGALSSR